MRTSTRYSLAAVMLSMLLAGGLSAQAVRRSGAASTSSNSSSTTEQTRSAQQTTSTRQATTTRQATSTQQVRRGTTETSSTKETTQTTQNTQNRETAVQNTQQQIRRSATSTTATRTGGSAGREANQTATRQSATTTNDRQQTTTVSANQNSGSANVTRRGLSSVSSSGSVSNSRSTDTRASAVPVSEYRVNNNNVERVAPRERAYQSYNTPKSFYGRDPHYYGWRVQSLPHRPKRVRYYGIDYYLYNDVYYRPYGGSYIVCRPPVGVVIAKTVKNLLFGRVTFAYYTDTYRSYRGWDSYSRYIDEQNRIIAQNNAVIAAQNRYLAMNVSSARSSYDIAYKLGLAQSYAYANWDYYYDDGVFYIINRNGRYEVIVPPAGALVDELPDDYETIILGGMELYRVDDTIYRTVLVSGRPYLEVLGQMYGSLASQYSIFR